LALKTGQLSVSVYQLIVYATTIKHPTIEANAIIFGAAKVRDIDGSESTDCLWNEMVEERSIAFDGS
jgi:hypothetical protein